MKVSHRENGCVCWQTENNECMVLDPNRVLYTPQFLTWAAQKAVDELRQTAYLEKSQQILIQHQIQALYEGTAILLPLEMPNEIRI